MRYTSYREIEQQARLAVTNAEKRRDDISKHKLEDPIHKRPFAYFLPSGYSSSPKSNANGFVECSFSLGR